jgi:predicted ABC-type exoprotein transport system permease subunit
MIWGLVIFLAVAVFAFRRVRRRREQLQEYASTGMLRSPLYVAQTMLTLVLLALMFAPLYLHHGRLMATIYVVVLGCDLAGLYVVRRALKWRYPV